jgi:hypothetical protein
MSVQPQPGGMQADPMQGYMTNQSMFNPQSQGFMSQPQM